MIRWILALAAALAVAGCAGGSGSSAGKPSPAATNPTDFPLFAGSEVLSARGWHETIHARPANGDNAIFTQGAGTYDGHDVVAGTQALMPSLETWLGDVSANPPSGYRLAMSGDQVEAVRAHTRELGIDFAVFESTGGGKPRGVAVLAVDPKLLDSKAGPMLGMIGKFHLMPQSFRDSIDAQAKKETGYTVTELTDPNTPVGAAIAALDELRDFGGRGVVIVDAVKE